MSVEDTYDVDIHDRLRVGLEVQRLADRCVRRLRGGRLVRADHRAEGTTVRLLHPDPPETLRGPTDDPAVVREAAARLLDSVDTTGGVRLLGVGVSGLADYTQEDLFAQAMPVPVPEEPEQGGGRGRRGAAGARRAAVARRAGCAARGVRARVGAGERAGAGHRVVRDAAVPLRGRVRTFLSGILRWRWLSRCRWFRALPTRLPVSARRTATGPGLRPRPRKKPGIREGPGAGGDARHREEAEDRGSLRTGPRLRTGGTLRTGRRLVIGRRVGFGRSPRNRGRLGCGRIPGPRPRPPRGHRGNRGQEEARRPGRPGVRFPPSPPVCRSRGPGPWGARPRPGRSGGRAGVPARERDGGPRRSRGRP